MKNWKSLLLAIASLAGCRANAAILTAVPMQGGMVMPMVSYHSADGRIHVTMPLEMPQLTPLLVSDPGDSFDPEDPWFETLDPSRQGQSFSRRYGFVMDTMTDPLPANTQIWIRKTTGPAELKLFRYKGSTPKVFEPIFGTAGVTNALYWNGMMFHPVASAPPGTNGFTATFEVFLRDTTTGREIPNSSCSPLQFNWTNLSDGRPSLRLVPGCVVAWPAETATNWVLECAAAPNTALWTRVTNAPVLLDNELCVTVDGGSSHQFFRMRFAP